MKSKFQYAKCFFLQKSITNISYLLKTLKPCILYRKGREIKPGGQVMLTPLQSVPSIKRKVELRSGGLICTGKMEITLDAIMVNSRRREDQP